MDDIVLDLESAFFELHRVFPTSLVDIPLLMLIRIDLLMLLDLVIVIDTSLMDVWWS